MTGALSLKMALAQFLARKLPLAFNLVPSCSATPIGPPNSTCTALLPAQHSTPRVFEPFLSIALKSRGPSQWAPCSSAAGIKFRFRGGCKNVPMLAAIESWFAAPGCDGAELDLAKGFDTVNWGAMEALVFSGTAPQMAAHLALGWKGPRYCSVSGSFSTPLGPNRSSPQERPASPRVLPQLLKLWHAPM